MDRLTGPQAIALALSKIDLDELESEQRELLRQKKKTSRPRAVRLLRTIQGLRSNDKKPSDLMISAVPVIPPEFRPFTVIGDSLQPGDANELYKDLLDYRKLYQNTFNALGPEAASRVYMDMVKSARALYGYGSSPNPKVSSRNVKGFFQAVTGTSPKHSFLQSKLLAKPVDTVGRAVIVPDPDLDMDQVGLPAEQAWKYFAPYVQRRMVLGGMAPPSALRAIKDRTDQAMIALKQEMKERPVVIARAPAWHRHNTTGQWAQLVDGDAMRINTFISDGHGADFDGDTMSVHVPSSPDAVADARDKLMASKMLFAAKNRNKTMGAPKHEQIIGLSMASSGGGQVRRFNSESEAMEAIQNRQISLTDTIEINDDDNHTLQGEPKGRDGFYNRPAAESQ